jgi:hypothetical protein
MVGSIRSLRRPEHDLARDVVACLYVTLPDRPDSNAAALAARRLGAKVKGCDLTPDFSDQMEQ